ncbi:MAG: argininosuccinate lyase [Micavibrio aeruginosavorus]|uniref:Argininosuccinate lyase n=1 Tax=Micavibrio aeruginosavorus TaxID=349221 RepID=A0A2W5BLA9_9BACT|nr:MAG: argininosuccinate lyase [Micavibrio aeruginosavorus]
MSKNENKTGENTMWGGRFSSSVSEIMSEINASIGVDQRLWRQDITGSIAHCSMLIRQGIIDSDDGSSIIRGLEQVKDEIRSGQFVFKKELEDIHMNIESRLKEIIGPIAGKLHTARSRNDQVATDFRLWVREAIHDIIERISFFQSSLKTLSEKHHMDIMPGFTHLQVAQPVTLGMHLHAYWEMLERDKSRFEDSVKRVNISPLGACALSGTGFPIDRYQTAKDLGFERPMANTLDAVSSRDFAMEFLFNCAQLGLNLSRLAEEIILWTTPQFGFMALSDQWATGSSIMPQKKNPDAAELIRAKTGRLNGNLVQLMTVMKALPLAYNKDMQEDKAAVFESFDTIILCLAAMDGMLNSASFKLSRMKQAAEDGYATATEIADWLVRVAQLPFRDAHHITGRIVKMAEERGCKLSDLDLASLQSIDNRITDDIYLNLQPEKAVESRISRA